MGLNQRMSPLGACFTITQSITVTSFNSLYRWEDGRKHKVFYSFINVLAISLSVVNFALLLSLVKGDVEATVIK